MADSGRGRGGFRRGHSGGRGQGHRGGRHGTRKDEEKDWYVLPHRVLAQLELTVAI